MPLDLLGRTPLSHHIPEEMKQIAEELSRCKDKHELVHAAYTVLTHRFPWDRLKTFTHATDLFRTDLTYLRNRHFLHCTNSLYILRHLLVASGAFHDSDIRLKWTLIRYVSPHQYAQVRIDNKRVDVDIRAATYWIKFWDHSSGFHGRLFKRFH